MSRRSDSTVPPLSRRRFLGHIATTGGAAILTSSCPASGQKPNDRAAADEALKGRLIFWSSTRSDPKHAGLFAYDFQSRKWPRVLDDAKPERFCRASPDGKSFVWTEGPRNESRILIHRPDGQTKLLGIRCRVLWSSDSQNVIFTEPSLTRPLTLKTWRMKADGLDRVLLPIPDNEWVLDWSPDGRSLLVAHLSGQAKLTHWTRRADGSDPRLLIDENVMEIQPGRFSPDGRRVAYILLHPKRGQSNLRVVDVATRRDRSIWEGDVDGYPQDSLCWSPDGKCLAVTVGDDTSRIPDHPLRIEVVDLEGRHIRQLEVPHQSPILCDWR